MTQAFDVLDRHLNIFTNTLLEASAGTGKTFSIENLVVRFLIESHLQGNPITLEKILVVTFTKAATRELKSRIRATIQKALYYFKNPSKEGLDYLRSYEEQGPEVVKKCIRILDKALINFDEAHIQTIHGFCESMLREHGFEASYGAHEQLTASDTYQIIRDFLRTKVVASEYTTFELSVVKKAFRSVDALQDAIKKELSKNRQVCPLPNKFEWKDELIKNFKHIKTLGLTSDRIQAELETEIRYYKNNIKKVQPESLKSISLFAEAFDKATLSYDDIEDILFIDPALDNILAEENWNKKGKPGYFIKFLQDSIFPYMALLRDPMIILARMVKDCRQLLDEYNDRREKFVPDEQLRKVELASKNHAFSQAIRNKFSVAIVDEFQDTDPIQWSIFKTLFLEGFNGYLYLVGDPKQSIYSFRQADIYTYLKAVEAVGHKASLNTNFRSQKSLVGALNILFQDRSGKGLIELPRLKQALSYEHVHASEKVKTLSLNDNKEPVHFILADRQEYSSNKSGHLEDEVFFPYIASEILRLKSEGIPFSKWAILISDKNQAERIASYLKKINIPTQKQRQNVLSEHLAYTSMKELLVAVLNPGNQSDIKIVLVSPLFGWSVDQLFQLDQQDLWLEISSLFHRWNHILHKEGFAALIYHVIVDTRERMIIYDLHYFDAFDQLANLVVEYENSQQASPYQILQYLRDLDGEQYQDNESLNVRFDVSREAVKILTMHMSKGLEFDFVFALGLYNKNRAYNKELITIPFKEDQMLAPESLWKDNADEIALESDAEKMRQLYVALTRAKYRVYIPLGILKAGKSEFYTLSDLFFHHLLNTKEKNIEQILSFLNNLEGSGISYAHISEALPLPKPYEENKTHVLHRPKDIQVAGNSCVIYSFTSLSKVNTADYEKVENVPHSYLEKNKTPHTLPAGKDIGTLMHKILEEIPLELVRKVDHSKELIPFISVYTAGTNFDSWEEILASIVYNAFHLPIIQGSKLVDMEFSFKEIEFLYPQMYCRKGVSWEDMVKSGDYIKGIIDLIFVYKGQYYIVDWKTNWLGTDSNSYTSEHLEKAMMAHEYHLQAEIYIEALSRYLEIVDPRPFEDIFGGVYYLFLRGLDLNQNGVYVKEISYV
jgi:exodeoxyribonuclease V beta subunit